MDRTIDVDEIATEVDRARIVLQMADARINELEGTGGAGKDDVFLVTKRIVLQHLDRIDSLLNGADDPR